MIHYANQKSLSYTTERILNALIKDKNYNEVEYDYITNHDITVFYNEIKKHLIDVNVDDVSKLTKIFIENIIITACITTMYDIPPEELIWSFTDMDNDVNHFTIEGNTGGKPISTHLFLSMLYESTELATTILNMYEYVRSEMINTLMSVSIIPLEIKINADVVNIIIGHLGEDVYQPVLNG